MHHNLAFWNLVIRLISLLLVLFQSLQTGDYHLLIAAVTKIAPLFFALHDENDT